MTKSRILVVDDDANHTRLVAAVLNDIGGYEVREENRSFAALHTAREFRPQLILLDLEMSAKDGGNVSAEFRQDPMLEKVPTIFVTSLFTKKEAGMHSSRRYLAKPVDLTHLLDTVRGLCPQFHQKAVIAQPSALSDPLNLFP